MKRNQWAGGTARYALATLGLVAVAAFAPSVLAQVATPSYFGGESWMPPQAQDSTDQRSAPTPAPVVAPPTSNQAYFGGESWTPEQAGPGVPGAAAVTAAEVAADRDLWIRSGMARLHQGEAGPDLNSAEYRDRLAVYSTLRGRRALAAPQDGGHEPRAGIAPAY